MSYIDLLWAISNRNMSYSYKVSPETQLFCNRYLIMCTVYTDSVHSRPRPCANGAHFLAWAQRKFHTRVRRAHKIRRRSEF